MNQRIVANFMRQQGFGQDSPESQTARVDGLLFQPRIVFPLILLATAFAQPLLFAIVSSILWWNTLLPKWNPFEWLYNRVIARPQARPLLEPAPAPRRLAQGIAATLTLGAAWALWMDAALLAWAFELLLASAFVALLMGRFCLGAYLYHLLRGRLAFVNATLPWGRGDVS